MLVTASSEALQQVLCIQYPLWFQKADQADKTKSLINFDSEINTKSLIYATKLGFITWKPSIKALKIDSTALETYGMVLARFLL